MTTSAGEFLSRHKHGLHWLHIGLVVGTLCVALPAIAWAGGPLPSAWRGLFVFAIATVAWCQNIGLVHSFIHHLPKGPRWLGSATARFANYLGGLSHTQIRFAHQLHHAHLGTSRDPDRAGYEMTTTLASRLRYLLFIGPLRARFAPVGIVSSPFTRAHQTAEIIASTLELPIEIEPEVREQFLGELHGQPYDAALATPGFETLPRWEWRPPAGETLLEVQRRAVGALLRIAGEWVGADVVVTSHAGTIQSCWAHVARDWQAAPHVPNCGVVVIEHDGRELARPELLLASS